MLDLGDSFRASVERDPNALAIVDGAGAADVRPMVPENFGADRRLRRPRTDAG